LYIYSYIFNSFLKRGFARFYFYATFLTHSFQIKNVIIFMRFLLMRNISIA